MEESISARRRLCTGRQSSPKMRYHKNTIPSRPPKDQKTKKEHSITSYMGNGQVNDDLCGHLTKTAIDPEELEPISVSMSLSVCVYERTYQSSTFKVVGAVGPLRELLLQLSSWLPLSGMPAALRGGSAPCMGHACGCCSWFSKPNIGCG